MLQWKKPKDHALFLISMLIGMNDKKKMVIASVKASCKAAGLDLDLFIDQLSDYIDQTISFVNDMSKKTAC